MEINNKENKKDNIKNKKENNNLNSNSIKKIKYSKSSDNKISKNKKKIFIEKSYDSNERKWNEKNENEQKINYKRGKFTPEEQKIITKSLCEYAYSNKLSSSELLELITEKQKKNKNKIWPVISKCLPNRSVQSIHNFCHRKFNPFNYKGEWTLLKEKALINLVKEHGKKWELIGQKLERTALNCKDKYKSLGKENNKERIQENNLNIILKFLKAIEIEINDENNNNNNLNENENEIKLFKYEYKFSKNLDKNFNVLFKYFDDKNKFYIDSSIKEEKSKIIIKNILKEIINFEILEEIYSNKKINWSNISNKILFFSIDDCKNEWNKIIREFEINNRESKKRDLKLINKIIKSGIDDINFINYENIHNKRKPSENKQKLLEYFKLYDIYNVKNFQDILNNIKDDLENEINNNNNNYNNKEFDDEIKRIYSNDITKIYNNFLQKKRGLNLE